MDIIPSDLNTYGGEAKRLLEDLQSRNERMFLVTALFLNTAKTKQALDNAIFQTAGIAQKYNCVLKRLDYQQEEGLMSSVPLGVNHIPIRRALTTTSTAIFVPFTTQELFMTGESLFYGLNALSNKESVGDFSFCCKGFTGSRRTKDQSIRVFQLLRSTIIMLLLSAFNP